MLHSRGPQTYTWYKRIMAIKNVCLQDIKYLIQHKELKLKSTQTKLSIPIINRIYKKMVAKIRMPPIKIQNDIICDGHHRYIASLLANYEIEMILWSSSASAITIDWRTVSFDDKDWDTQEEIRIINQQDACNNKVELDVILNLLQ